MFFTGTSTLKQVTIIQTFSLYCEENLISENRDQIAPAQES